MTQESNLKPLADLPRKPTRLATAAMWTGIAAVALWYSTWLTLAGLVVSIPAIVLSALALRRIERGTGAGLARAVAGLVFGLVALMHGLQVAFFWAMVIWAARGAHHP